MLSAQANVEGKCVVAVEEKSHTAKGTAHHSFGSILIFHAPG